MLDVDDPRYSRRRSTTPPRFTKRCWHARRRGYEIGVRLAVACPLCRPGAGVRILLCAPGSAPNRYLTAVPDSTAALENASRAGKVEMGQGEVFRSSRRPGFTIDNVTGWRRFRQSAREPIAYVTNASCTAQKFRRLLGGTPWSSLRSIWKTLILNLTRALEHGAAGGAPGIFSSLIGRARRLPEQRFLPSNLISGRVELQIRRQRKSIFLFAQYGRRPLAPRSRADGPWDAFGYTPRPARTDRPRAAGFGEFFFRRRGRVASPRQLRHSGRQKLERSRAWGDMVHASSRARESGFFPRAHMGAMRILRVL